MMRLHPGLNAEFWGMTVAASKGTVLVKGEISKALSPAEAIEWGQAIIAAGEFAAGKEQEPTE